MPRRLRLFEVGAWYHIGNRGLNHRAIFETEADARRFLGLLAELCFDGLIEVHAYCVMTNHFHLLVRSTEGNLSEALQWIESIYVSKFNRGRGRDGSLLKGRFFAKQVKSDAYRKAILEYIDANPVEARIASSAAAYPYSSTHHYLRPDGPPWLTRTWVEGVVCAATGTDTYDPASYPAVFGRKWTPAALRWFARFSEGLGEDETTLDGILAARPEHIQRWFDRCAKEADGTVSRPPIIDTDTALEVIATCEAARPDWKILQFRRSQSGWNILRVGLLRDLASESFAEIGRRLGAPSRTVYDRYPEHCRLLESDAEYRTIVETTATMIVTACHGDVNSTPLRRRTGSDPDRR